MIRQFLALVFSTLLVASAAMAQEHAPTLAQCQADVAVWNDAASMTRYLDAETEFMERGTPNQTEIQKLSMKELFLRIREMADCGKVDPSQPSAYNEVVNFYDIVKGDRMRRFLTRHNLMAQFMREDAAGKR